MVIIITKKALRFKKTDDGGTGPHCAFEYIYEDGDGGWQDGQGWIYNSVLWHENIHVGARYRVKFDEYRTHIATSMVPAPACPWEPTTLEYLGYAKNAIVAAEKSDEDALPPKEMKKLDMAFRLISEAQEHLFTA